MNTSRTACLLGMLLTVWTGSVLNDEPRQTEDEGRAQLVAFAGTYSTSQEWEARARNIREGFLREAHLSPLPARCELRPIIRGRQERSGYTVENFAIEALPGFFMTGNLFRPTVAIPPLAGILCPQIGRAHV